MGPAVAGPVVAGLQLLGLRFLGLQSLGLRSLGLVVQTPHTALLRSLLVHTAAVCRHLTKTHTHTHTAPAVLLPCRATPTGPRLQINEATAWLDASCIYGETEQTAKLIRAGEHANSAAAAAAAASAAAAWQGAACCAAFLRQQHAQPQPQPQPRRISTCQRCCPCLMYDTHAALLSVSYSCRHCRSAVDGR